MGERALVRRKRTSSLSVCWTMFLDRRRTELMLRLKEGGGGEVQGITGPAGREGGRKT